MTDGQAVPPPAVTAIAAMLESRYSGQPTQRDLDVANVAYAAGAATERERLRRLLSERAGATREAARLARADGDDELAEIYVGQALAYESLPGLLEGGSNDK